MSIESFEKSLNEMKESARSEQGWPFGADIVIDIADNNPNQVKESFYRPENREIANVVAKEFNVSMVIAYKWLMEFNNFINE